MRKGDPVVGDLLEEYRESVLPARGRLRATLWFAGQLASLGRPWMWGLLLGLGLASLNLVSTAMAPLAEDTPWSVLAAGVAIMGAWVMVGFSAERRRQRFTDAILASIVVATLSTAIFSAGNFARKMLFLDTIQHRSDWQGLMQRYQASGAHDLRTFVTDEHLRGLPGGLLFSVCLGAVCGGLGGAYSSWRREQPSRMDVT